jgi:hypothetical protein
MKSIPEYVRDIGSISNFKLEPKAMKLAPRKDVDIFSDGSDPDAQEQRECDTTTQQETKSSLLPF